MQQHQQQPGSMPGIMVEEPGKPPRMLAPEEIMNLLNGQMQEIQHLNARNKELQDMVINLQNQILMSGRIG